MPTLSRFLLIGVLGVAAVGISFLIYRAIAASYGIEAISLGLPFG
ncbi:MAG: hypothetical protein ABJL72_16580 [Roseobacter sp.]